MFFENELSSLSDYEIDAFVQDNLKRNVNVLLHWHECFELLYVIEGDAVQNLNNKVFDTRKGDLIVIKKGDIHSTLCKKGDDVRIIVVKFLPSFIKSIFPTEYDSVYITSFLNMQNSPVKNLDSSVYKDKIANVFDMILKEYSEKENGFETSIKALLTVLINDIIRMGLLEYGTNSISVKDKTKKDISSLLKMIENNFSDRKFSLTDLAKHTHYNYSYCSRFFKKHTGKGFLEFLNFVRICEAEKLIIQDQDSITRIAHLCGFGNASVFAKTYKRVRGYSPSFLKKVKN